MQTRNNIQKKNKKKKQKTLHCIKFGKEPKQMNLKLSTVVTLSLKMHQQLTKNRNSRVNPAIQSQDKQTPSNYKSKDPLNVINQEIINIFFRNSGNSLSRKDIN